MARIPMRAVFSALIAAACAISGPAMAQQTPDPLAIPPSPAQEYASSPGGVDMRTGQYMYSKTDLQSAGPGGIDLNRTNGDADWKMWNVMGQFTHNWHIYATYAPIKGGGANFTVEGARGQQFITGSNTNNFYTLAANARASLEAVPTGSNPLDRYLVYTAADGTKITFREENEAVQRLQSDPSVYQTGMLASKVENPDGTTFTLAYDPPAGGHPTLLRRVTSNTGSVLIFEYGVAAGWKMISKACLFNAAVEAVPSSNSCSTASYEVSYGYGANGYMTSATDALGNTSTYSSTYSDAAWDAAVAAWPNTNYTWTDKFYHSGANTPYLTNTKYRNLFVEYVQSQDFAEGADYTYSWNITEHHEASMEVAGGTATRSDGETMTVGYQEMTRPGYTYGDSYVISEGPDLIIDELGRRLESDYCVTTVIQPQPGYPGSGGAVGCAAVSARYWKRPEGNQTDYEYNGWGSIVSTTEKAKPGSSEPDITRSYTYDCTNIVHCRKPITVTDGKGNTTNATYSGAHGGILTRTLPPDASGIRPQTRYSYAQKYAWTKNGGSYVQSPTPVWLLMSEEFCKTTAASGSGCVGGASDEVVTSYEYEQGSSSKGSNLLLLGTAITADGQTLRACYTYDKWGRRISETQPKAGLTSCQ